MTLTYAQTRTAIATAHAARGAVFKDLFAALFVWCTPDAATACQTA